MDPQRSQPGTTLPLTTVQAPAAGTCSHCLRVNLYMVLIDSLPTHLRTSPQEEMTAAKHAFRSNEVKESVVWLARPGLGWSSWPD